MHVTNQARFKNFKQAIHQKIDSLGTNTDNDFSSSLSSQEIKNWINQRNSYLLRRACDYGYFEIAELLLEYGAEIHHLDYEAVRLASQNGHLKIVEMLFSAGSKMDSKQEYSLRAASALGHQEIVKFLLTKTGSDLRVYDGFAIICAKDEAMRNILLKFEESTYTAEERQTWRENSNFGKYGDRFCQQFEYDNLPFADGVRLRGNFWLIGSLAFVAAFLNKFI